MTVLRTLAARFRHFRSSGKPTGPPAPDNPGQGEEKAIQKTRKAIAMTYLSGRGIEVGAGDRPFPLPEAARVSYGDIRPQAGLENYFKTTKVTSGELIDGQTFAGFEDGSLDFVISAHVIEHLRDPMGAIVNAIRVLKIGGIHIVVVPEMRATFDRNRPETTVEHALRDFKDGGESTCRAAYEEHLRYVHPYMTGETHSEQEIDWQVGESAKRWQELDIHFHAWTRRGFEELLGAASQLASFRLETAASVVNENIFVLRKLAGPRRASLLNPRNPR